MEVIFCWEEKIFFIVSIIFESLLLDVIFDSGLRGLLVFVEIKNFIRLMFFWVSCMGWLLIIGVLLVDGLVFIRNFVLNVDLFIYRFFNFWWIVLVSFLVYVFLIFDKLVVFMVIFLFMDFSFFFSVLRWLLWFLIWLIFFFIFELYFRIFFIVVLYLCFSCLILFKWVLIKFSCFGLYFRLFNKLCIWKVVFFSR